MTNPAPKSYWALPSTGFSLAGTPRALSAALARLRAALDLPDRLPVEPEELKASLDDLSAAALDDGCMTANPIPLTADEVKDLLAQAGGLGGRP